MGDAETWPSIIGQEAVYILESLLQANTLKRFHIFNIVFFFKFWEMNSKMSHIQKLIFCVMADWF